MDKENKKIPPLPVLKGQKIPTPPVIPGFPKQQAQSLSPSSAMPKPLGAPPSPGGIPSLPKISIPSSTPSAIPASPDSDGRTLDLNRKVHESEQVRRQLEGHIDGLQKQLMEEREKLLIQTVRAKEEEALATKVESSIKDMQEKLRRSQREQELMEELSKAESQIKELEKRIGDERETWVATLKTQLSERDLQDKDVENTFQQKIRDLERKWQEEKNTWAKSLHDREADISDLKNQIVRKEEDVNRVWERKVSEMSSEKLRTEDDNRAIRNLLSGKDKELVSLKAEIALVNSGMMQEKEKIDRYRMILSRFKQENESLMSRINDKENEFNTIKNQMSMLHAKYKAELDKSNADLAVLKDKATDLEHEKEMLSQNFSFKETELKNLIEKNHAELGAAKTDYEVRLREKEAEIQNYIDRENELIVKQAEERQKVEGLIAQIEQRNTAINELKAEKNQLLEDGKRLQSDLSELKKEKESLKEEIVKLTHEVELSSRDSSARESELKLLLQKSQEELHNAKAEFENRIKDKDSEINRYVSEEEKLRGEIKDRERRIHDQKTELDSQINNYRVQVEQKNNFINQLESQAEIHKMKNRDLETVVLNKDNEVQQLKIEITKTNELGKVKEATITELREQVKNIDLEVAKRMAERENEFRKKSEYLDELNNSLKKQLGERDKKLDEMFTREQELKEQYRAVVARVDKEIGEEKGKFEKLLSQKEAELGELVKNKAGIEEQLNKLTVSIAEKESDFQRQLGERDSRLAGMDDLAGSKAALEERLGKLSSSIMEKEGDFHRQLAERDRKLEEIIAREQELQGKYQEMVTKAELELNNERERFNSFHAQKEEEIRQLNENKAKLQESVDALTASINEKGELLEKQKLEAELYKEKSASVQVEVKKHEEMLNTSRQAMAILESKFYSEKESYLKNLADANRQWEEKLSIAKAKIVELDARLNQEKENYNRGKENYTKELAQVNMGWEGKIAEKEMETRRLVENTEILWKEKMNTLKKTIDMSKKTEQAAGGQQKKVTNPVPAGQKDKAKITPAPEKKGAFACLRDWLNKPMFKR